jgi:hypothetical protein
MSHPNRRSSSHKAAISLNNAAVSLLVRGRCSEALETFEDAVKVLDVASLQDSYPHSETSQLWSEQVRLTLERASKRTALCSTIPPLCQNEASTTATTATERGLPTLKVISSQCNPARIYETLTSCVDTASLHVAFPMTIDPVDLETCTSEHVSFEIGVVLHNYGVAYDCVAAKLAVPQSLLSPEDVNFRSMVQAKAFHLFQWSSALLAKLDLESHHIMPACLASQLLLLRTVLTHNLINDSIVLNLDFEYREYCLIMQSLLQLVEAQHLLLPINDHHIAAAA